MLASPDGQTFAVITRSGSEQGLHGFRVGADAALQPLPPVVMSTEELEKARMHGTTVAWQRAGVLRTVDLTNGAIGSGEAGWALGFGHPLHGVDAAWLATQPRFSPAVRQSPDERWFFVDNVRLQTSAVFDATEKTEAKALAKKVMPLAISNRHVLVSPKPAEWQLLAMGTWKKVGSGALDSMVLAAALSPDGHFAALVTSASGTSTVTIVGTNDGAVVGTVRAESEVASAAWIAGGRLLVALVSRRLGAPATAAAEIWTPPLPSVAVVPEAPTKPKPKAKEKAAAAPPRSPLEALELPFALVLATDVRDLEKLGKGERLARPETDTAKLEAMLLYPLYAREVRATAEHVSLAAALLLRRPLTPARIDAVIAANLAHPDVQAVLPRLDEHGKARLAVIRAIAGETLSAEDKIAFTRFVAGEVWAGRSEYTTLEIPIADKKHSRFSTYETVAAIVETYGDVTTLRATVRQLWTEGRAPAVHGLDAELAAPFEAFSKLAIANRRVSGQAFEARWRSEAGKGDTVADVQTILAEPLDSKATDDAWMSALAYAVLVHQREGKPLPPVRGLLTKTVLSPMKALAVAAYPDDAKDDAWTRAWITAARRQWPALAEQLAKLDDGARTRALGEYLATSVGIEDAERIAPAMITNGALEKSGFALLLARRDAGLPVSPEAWFDSEPTGRFFPRALVAALQTFPPEFQSRVVERWLEVGKRLDAAGQLKPKEALAAAILHGKPQYIPALTGGEQATWLPIFEAHLPDSKAPEEIVAAAPYDVRGRLSALIATNEPPLEVIRRLAGASGVPTERVVLLCDHQTVLGAAAKSGYFGVPSKDPAETYVCSIHFDDEPALRSRFPGAASLSVFARRGKPSALPTRVEPHAPDSDAHRTIEAGKSTLRAIAVELPNDYFAMGSGPIRHQAIRNQLERARAYAQLVVSPHFAQLTEQPVLLVVDPPYDLMPGGEGDEGSLLVFENGRSYCQYA